MLLHFQSPARIKSATPMSFLCMPEDLREEEEVLLHMVLDLGKDRASSFILLPVQTDRVNPSQRSLCTTASERGKGLLTAPNNG